MFFLHLHMVHHPVNNNAGERSTVLDPNDRARYLNYSRKILSRNTTDFETDQTSISDVDQQSKIS